MCDGSLPINRGASRKAETERIRCMKKHGIRWKRTNAVALVALRVQQINADWETAA